MRKKRGVIKLWTAILLVFAGFIGVAGITTLSLYLTGRFDEDVVPPQDINFVQELGEGSLGFYDADAHEYKVSSDFSLTISSSTENVTQKKITLSLNGEKKPDAEGYISNGIIKVPQTVQLDRPFEVVLEKDAQGYVQGGIAKITAKSQNSSITYPTVKVVVDVPVESLDVSVHVDKNAEPNFAEVQEVVVGAEFTLDAYFTPGNSAYLFANSLESKKIFYATTSSYVEYDWNSARFVAKEKSGSDTAEVMVYTFANSYYQKKFMDEFEKNYPNATEKQLTERAVTYFTNNPSVCVLKTIKIKVVDIDIESVSFNDLAPINITADKKFTLTANSNNGDSKLGLSILDSNDTPLNALFANVGIRIPKSEDISVAGAKFSIVGGKVMKVVSQADGTFDITCEEYSATTDYAGAPDGTEYYVLANNAPAEYNDYCWQLSSSDELEAGLKFNFFFQDDEGEWQNFFKFEEETSTYKAGEPSTTATVTPRYEEPLSWISASDQIVMEITYDETGATIPCDVNLNDLLDSPNPENIYTTVRYFLFVEGQIDVSSISDVFNCATTSKTYSTNYVGAPLYSTVNREMPTGGYALYELDGSVLTAVNTFVNKTTSTGKVFVVAGVVKTNSEGQVVNTDGEIYKDGDNYVLVSLNYAKEIVVNNTLSIANMTPTFTIEDATIEAVDEKYYIPAINVDESGTQKTMLTFTLTLDKKTDGDADKLLTAYIDKKLKVVCMDGMNESEHLKLEGLALNSALSTESTLVFKGSISINETLFNAERPYDGKELKLKLVYDDGKGELSKVVYNSKAEADNEKPADACVYIYYQRVSELTMPKLTYTDADGDGVIDNYISVSNKTNSFTVEWKDADGNVDETISGASKSEIIAKLNEFLQSYIVDQFGKEIDASVYATILEEENKTAESFNKASSPIIGLSGDLTNINNFSVSSNSETYLAIYVVDNKTTNVDKYVYESTGSRLSLPKIKFVITSEGVDHIKQDNTTVVKASYVDSDYAPSPTTGSATVSKYVTTDDKVEMNDLIKVYTTSDDTSFLTNLQFRLTTTDAEILKMVTFYDADEKELSPTEATEKDVVSMKFLSPFGKKATIKFVVFNESGTFDIELNFVCLADATIAYNFDKYKTTANEDYLLTCPTNANIASVFADNEYDLDTYLTIGSAGTNSTYSWNNSVIFSTTDRNVLSFNSSSKKLEIKAIFQYKTVTFTIYYKVQSEFAPQANVSLYVNPNIIIREVVSTADGNPTINVADLGGEIALSTAYQFYKATSFIEKNKNTTEFTFDGVETLTPGFTYVYSASTSGLEQYVKISENKFVINDDESRTLSLILGEEFLQKFAIKSGTDGTDSVDAIKVRIVDGESIVVLADPDEHTQISIALGFSTGVGSDPDVATIQEVFKTNISTVTYNGKVHLLLKEGGEYTINDGYGLDSTKITGDLTIGSGGVLKAKATSGFFSPSGTTENTFVVTKTISTALTVNIKMRAIVSKIGDKFVAYNEKYNTFGNVDFKTLISTNATELETAGVYQEVSAGQLYVVVNNDTANKLGFYYNSANDSALADTTPTLTIEKVTGTVGGVTIAIDGLVSIDKTDAYTINISHLAEGLYNDVYVVLRLTFSSANSTFSWLYRIKITPSFNVGSVTYPFVDGVEYLDENSASYVDTEDKYVVNLTEMFTFENSNEEKIGKNRFTAPTVVTGLTPITFAPSFTFAGLVVNGEEKDLSEMSTYFEEYGFGSKQEMTLKLREVYKTTPISVTVEAIYKVDGATAIGSEIEYNFALNQGKTYIVTLTQKEVGGTEKALTSKASGKNIYDAMLTAGEEETELSVLLQYRDGIIGTIEADKISAYLKEDSEDLSNALMKYVVLKAGAEFTLVTSESEPSEPEQSEESSEPVALEESADPASTYTLEENMYIWVGGVGEVVEIEHDGATYQYTITEGDLTGTGNLDGVNNYFYLTSDGNKKILHIKPKSTVDQDYFFEIGFYTDEKTALTIDLTVTSYYSWELNATENFEFVGGEKYTFLKQTPEEGKEQEINYIFEELKNDNGGTISNVEISLTNATTAYSNADGYGVKGLTLGDLVKIKRDSSWRNSTIEFAPMTNSATFTFEVKIYKPKVGGAEGETELDYTFIFSINVGANFTATSASYTNSTAFIGGDEISVAIGNIIDTAKGINTFLNETTFAFAIEKVGADGKQYTSYDNISTTANLTSLTAGEKFEIKDYDIVALFGEGSEKKEILRIPFTYTYTSKPNVTLNANYPKPNGETSAKCEYLGATATNGVYSAKEENFFKTKGLFATDKRVVAESKKIQSASGEIDAPQYWAIKVAEIQGLKLSFSVDGTEKTIISTSENKNVLTTDYNVDNSATATSLAFTFTLDDGVSEGGVTFEVEVNKVTVSYIVKVVAGGNVTLKLNTPNYDDNIETIYAEDLAKQEQNIFASDRILTYTLKSTNTYYLKFTNGTQSKIVTITGEADKTVIMDVGESLVGYQYFATYTTCNIDESGTITGVTESSKVEDDDVYVEGGEPVLTARVTPLYADGTKIKGSNLSLKYSIGGGTESDLDTFTLSGNEVGQTKTLNITAQYTQTVEGNTTTVEVGTTTYKVKLEIDFVVTNNADKVNNGALPFYTDIEAQLDDTNSPNLLDLSEVFGIKTVRGTSQYLTQDLMKQTGGNITLEEYGFTTCTVDFGTGDDSLAKTAGQVHNILINNLRKNANGDYVYYYTGLTPRAGYTAGQINTIGQGESSANNYIALLGIKDGGNSIDWKLWAQGANNDGNFVMMKLTYSVALGSSSASVSHNILFRVLPNSNIKFRDEYDSQVTSTSQVFNGRSVATNSYDPYTITDSMFKVNGESKNFTLTLFDTATESNSRVIANMKASTDNTIHKFTFNYRANISEAGADFNSSNVLGLNRTNFKDESQWTISTENMTATSIVSAPSLAITFNSTLAWGEKEFYVEFEDMFGYVGRFYFTLVSSSNPKISSITIDKKTTREFTEGSAMQFGAQYVEITPITTNVDGNSYITFASFEYIQKTYAKDVEVEGTEHKKDEPVSGTYNNYLIFKDVSNITITDVILIATLKNSLTVTVDGGSATLPSGTMITKTISSLSITSQENVQIDGGSGQWSATIDGTAKNITWTNSNDNNLVGASIVLQLKATKTEGADVPGKFSVLYTYQNTAPSDSDNFVSQYLTQSVSVGETTDPQYSQNTEPKTIGITFSGINAYGLNPNNAFSQNVLNSYISQVANVTVTGVEFWYKGKKIGSGTGASEINLTTDTSLYFYDGTNDSTSFAKSQTGDVQTLTVPYIDGLLYGTGDTLSDVDMYITLNDGSNECKLHETVTFKRKLSSETAFGSDKVLDNESPTSSGNTLLNDTLEISLESGESITFVINDSTINGIDKDGYLKNGANKVAYYAVTTDTQVNPNKTYYVYNTSSNQFGQAYTKVFTSGTTYYELTATANTNATPVFGTTYYTRTGNETDGYTYTSETLASEFVTGTTYYTLTATEVTYTTPVSDTTYYTCTESAMGVYSYKEATLADGFRTGITYYEQGFKQANFITLTNDKPYAVTEYVGISASILNLQKNLASGSEFYIYIQNHTKNGKATDDNPTIIYNGNLAEVAKTGDITEDDGELISHTYTISGKIGAYSGITLNIENIAELSTTDKTTKELLYFLLNSADSGETYQYQKVFTVYPQYTKAEADGEIIVDNYVTVSNGTKEYYVIGVAGWTDNISLTKEVTSSSIENAIETSNAYKFRFDVSSESGAVYIDENGTITTSDDFDINTGYFKVSVYIKMSGNDGQFEDDNTDYLLGTFVVRLKPKEDGGSSESSSEQGYHNIANNAPFVVKNGYYIVGSEGYTLDLSANTYTSSSTIACPVGEKLDLHKILDKQTLPKENDSTNSLDLTTLANKTYHLVKITNKQDSSNYKYINVANIDTYTFDTAGSYELEVILTYRDKDKKGTSDDKNNNALIEIPIIVYDTSASAVRETRYKEVETNSEIVLGNADNETWWLLEDGKAEEKLAIEFGATGRYEKQFLVMNVDNTFKLVNYTFYVYDSDETVYKSVAMVVASHYKLANLVDDASADYQYTFYHQNAVKTEEYFENTGKGGNLEVNYILITTGATGSTATKYVVIYKIVGGTTDLTESAYIPVSEIHKATADESPVEGKIYYTYDAGTKLYTKVDVSAGFAERTTYYEKVEGLSQNDVFGTIKTLFDLNDFKTVHAFASGEKYYYNTSMKDKDGNLITSGNFVIIQEYDIETGLLKIADDVVTNWEEYKLTRNYVVTYGISNNVTTKTLTLTFFKHEKVITGSEAADVTTSVINTGDKYDYSYNSDTGAINLTYTSAQEYTDFDLQNLSAVYKNVLNKLLGDGTFGDADYVTVFEFDNVVASFDFQKDISSKPYYVKVGNRYFLFNIELKIANSQASEPTA